MSSGSLVEQVNAAADRSVSAPESSLTGHDRGRAGGTGAAVRPSGARGLLAVWRRLAVFALGQAGILVCVEAYLICSAGGSGAAPVQPYRYPTPFVEFYQRPNYDGSGIRTNDVGFRYEDLELTKPTDEIRVFFLSTSVGFNGTTNEATISGLMESSLASMPRFDPSRIRVINASGVSFCSSQSLHLLVTKILDYDPDVLIVFHGPESLFIPTDYESRPGYPFNFALREGRGMSSMADRRVFGSVERWLMRTQTMCRLHPDLLEREVQSSLSKMNNSIEITRLAQYDPYINVLADDVSKIVRIASGFDIKVLVAVPPCRYRGILVGAMDRLEDRVRLAVEPSSDVGARFVSTRGLSAQISDAAVWHSDGVHWGDEGNRFVADYLLEALLETGWLGASEYKAEASAARQPVQSDWPQTRGGAPLRADVR